MIFERKSYLFDDLPDDGSPEWLFWNWIKEMMIEDICRALEGGCNECKRS